MDATKMNVDAIGVAKEEKVTSFLDSLKAKWEALKANFSSVGKISMTQVTKFLFMALDSLIVFVDGMMDKGPDKKATVLASFATLYDFVVKGFLPIWLKPFAGALKSFVVSTVASLVIDWIVSKYNDGSWSKKELNGTDKINQ